MDRGRMIARATITALALLASPAQAIPADRFDTLKALVGEWRGTSSEGRSLRVGYRLIAADTVLVETWTSASGRETMTLYHRDGDALLATHYCAQGNQPRLDLVDEPGPRLRFTLRDITNLTDPRRSHQHDVWIEPIGPDRMLRAETYVTDGKPATERAELQRVSSTARTDGTPPHSSLRGA